MKFSLSKIVLTLVVFGLSLTPILWFKGDQILIGYDNVYPLNPVEFLKDRFFSWTQAQNFGHDQSGVQGSLIIHFIDSIPSFFGFSSQLSQKIVFSFWFFLLILSPYILIQRLEKYGFIKAKYLRYIFPVLIAFNFYILQAWWVAERAKFSVIIATLLILSLLVPLIKLKLTKMILIRNSFICATILAVFNGGGWEGISLYGGFLVFYLCFYLFFIAHAIHMQRKKRILELTFFSLFFGIWYALLNFYTFLPFILTTLKNYEVLYQNAGGIEGLIGWTRYLSVDTSFLNLLRLQGIPDLYNNGLGHPYAPFYLNRSILISASYLFPVFLFFAFWKKRRESAQIYIFFLIALLASLFLTAGTHEPLGFLFEKIMRTVPGFLIFRSAVFKFGYTFWITASFFIGVFISDLVEYLEKRVKRFGPPSFIGFFLFIAVVGSILFYYFPYFKGDIFRINRSGLSSRVEIPQYAYNFSKWWTERDKGERILLLPKLNSSWLFEQYNWGYLSLFPLLKNFGNSGIVENTDFLLPNEEKIVNRLYAAINDQDYGEQEMLTSMLSIRYFLVRNDFYYNFSNQETDNPSEIKKKLDENPNVNKLAQFGEWSVYEYKRQKPLIFSSIGATAGYGSGFDIPNKFNNDLLLIDNKFYPRYPGTFSDTVIWPECLSCKAELIDIEVTAPKPKVLFDSYFYDFIQFVDSLKHKNNQKTAEDQMFDLVGNGLYYVAQVNELVLGDKNEDFVRRASDKLLGNLSMIYDSVPDLIDGSQNPYISVVILNQYMQAYDEYMGDLVSRTNRRDILIALQKIQFSIEEIRDSLKKFYWVSDFNRKKIYKASIASQGAYTVLIRKNSLGFTSEKDQLEMKFAIDEEDRPVTPKIDGEYINFGQVLLDEGFHIISIFLPVQRNLFANAVSQKIAGKSCYSSYFDKFNVKNNYDLQFLAKNTSGGYMSVFIDDGQVFAPTYVNYFAPGVGRFSSKRVVVSKDKMHFESRAQALRVGFCSSTLTESEYLENIRDLSLTVLTEPEIIFYKKEADLVSEKPDIEYIKIDPTHYRVEVKGAENPFYLNFNQRFSNEWKADGVHLESNKYANAWLIDKKGDFVVDIFYNSQNFFSIGLAVSSSTFVAGLIILIFSRKRKYEDII